MQQIIEYNFIFFFNAMAMSVCLPFSRGSQGCQLLLKSATALDLDHPLYQCITIIEY